MKWMIVADSGCDMTDDYEGAPGAGFATVPMSIEVDGRVFKDDEHLDMDEFLHTLKTTTGTSRSACPSPDEWMDHFMKADQTIAVTMSSGISGTYNSARMAMEMVLEKHPEKKIHVIDTLSISGQAMLVIWRINELIGAGHGFENIVQLAEAYNKELRVLFSLCSYDNLIKNGRLNKMVGLAASKLNFYLIGKASEKGTLQVMGPARGLSKALAKIVREMGILKNVAGKPVVITHCNNASAAEKLGKLVEETYQGAKALVYKMRGLTSFYAEESGMIIAF
ncbi:MAG: DegV family protein [Christensenellales bacterium]|jgi:DegV family protein with EDD domain